MNYLTFIKEIEREPNGQKKGLYKCVCGNEKITRMTRVKNNFFTHCGCKNESRKKIIIEPNTQFGNLIFIKENGNIGKRKSRMGIFKCICGKEKSIRVGHVINKKIKSCGCIMKETCKKGVEAARIKTTCIGPKSCFNFLFLRYKREAKSRNYKFNLPKKVFKKLLLQECHYCKEPPSNSYSSAAYKLYYNGIDRKDNNKHYTIDNCVSCCFICNKMKMNLDYNKFIEKCSKIRENFINLNENKVDV